jgi:hypothetical protein
MLSGLLLPLQVMDCEFRALLLFQGTLNFSSFGQSRHFFLGDDLKRISQSLRSRSVAAHVLREAAHQDRQLNRYHACLTILSECKPKAYRELPGGRIELPTKGL